MRTSFPCDQCAKEFSSKASLRVHVRATHEQSRPFPCTVGQCTEAFAYKHTLQRHLKNVHGKSKSDIQKLAPNAKRVKYSEYGHSFELVDPNSAEAHELAAKQVAMEEEEEEEDPFAPIVELSDEEEKDTASLSESIISIMSHDVAESHSSLLTLSNSTINMSMGGFELKPEDFLSSSAPLS